MPIADPDFEWLKIAGSTLAGLFAGLIAEPIKSTLQRKIEIIRLERAIGLDCLRIITGIVATQHGLVEKPENYWKMDPLPAYDHYWQSKRELFYSDWDLQIIQLTCLHIQLTRSSVLEGRMEPDMGLKVTESLAKKILDVRTDKKGLRPRLRKILLKIV